MLSRRDFLRSWWVAISGYSASSTTKTGRHDIAEILLKVVLSTTMHMAKAQYFWSEKSL
jgi:hypothetical protein